MHAGQNRGAMLSIGYWCEDGCQGHIELRNHKGYLFASVHNDPAIPEEDRGPFRIPGGRRASA
jgi:hypothetical protein